MSRLVARKWFGTLVFVLGCAIGSFAQDAPGTPDLDAPADQSVSQPLSVDLIWEGVYGADSYTVQVSTDPGFATTVTQAGSLAGTDQVITGLSHNTGYYWRVKAVGAGGESDYQNPPYEFTTVIDAPALSSPADGSTNMPVSINFQWGAASGADSYTLQLSFASDFGTIAASQTGIAGTSQTMSSLANSAAYYWRVKSVNNSGNGEVWSAVRSFTTTTQAPGTPVLSTPVSGSIDQPQTTTLAWTPGAGGTPSSYAVQVSTSSGFSTLFYSTSGIVSTSTTVGSLARGVTYYWRANATNGGGTSAWSDGWSFVTIPYKPGAPGLATPANNTANLTVSPTLNWNNAAGATSYVLQVSTVSTFSTSAYYQAGVVATSQAIGPLANSTGYYWHVNASNAGGTSSWSALWNFATIVAAPGAPALSSPADNAANQAISLSLTWSAGTGGTPASYALQVSTAADFSNPVYNNNAIASTSAPVSGLDNSTVYYWQVRATNANTTGAWSAARSFTTIMAAPGAPGLTAPTSNKNDVAVGGTTLTWGAVATAAGYTVQLSTAADFGSPLVNTSQGGTSIGTGALTAGTKYYWRVNASNAGGAGSWSADSFSVPAIPAAPGLTAPTPSQANVAVGGTTLTWSVSTGATDYTVIMSANANFSSPIVNTNQAGTSIGTGALTAGTKYYWEVNSHNNGGTSAWSIDSFSVPAIPGSPTLANPTTNQTDVAVGGAAMKWNTVSGAAAYTVVLSPNANYSSPIINESVTDTSKATGSLTAGTTYYWQVKATNNGGASAFAQDSFAVPALPAAPSLTAPASGLSTVAVGGTNLQWGAASGASTYTVVLSSAANFSNPSVNTTLSGTSQATGVLAAGTKYYWEVKSNNNGGSSAWTVDSFSVPAVPSVPSLTSPTPNQADVAVGGTTLTWGASAGAATYAVVMSASADYSAPIVNTSQGGTSIGTGALTAGTKYYWKVNASNNGGTSAWSIDSFSVPAIPAAPSLTTPTPSQANVAVGGTTLTWSASTGATDYTVIMSANANFSSPIVNTNQAGTSIGTGALTAGTKYYWEVNSHNNGGTSAWSIDSFSVPAVPAVPTLANPTTNQTDVAVGGAAMKWNTASGAAAYTVVLSPNANYSSPIINESVTDTSRATGSLTAGTTYYWEVKATNNGGASAFAQDSFAVPALPATPSLTAPTTNENDILVGGTTLTWGAAAGAVNYTVVLSTAADFSNPIINTSQGGTSKATGALTAGATYYWQVRSTNNGGTSAWAADAFSVPAIPAAPSLTSPTPNQANVAVGGTTLTWGVSAGAATYAVVMSANADFSAPIVNTSQGGTSIGTGALTAGTKYYWKVNASNNGGTSVWSADSFSVPAIPAAPSLTSPTPSQANVAVGGTTLTWSASTGATDYNVIMSPNANFSSPIVNTNQAGTSIGTGALTAGTKYYWEVNSHNNGGTSAWSIDSFSVPAVPSAPSFTAPTPSENDIAVGGTTLTWGAVGGATSYTVVVSAAADFSSPIINVTQAGVSKVTGILVPGTTYYWRVNAFNNGGSSSWTSDQFSVPPVPVTPTLTTPGDGDENISVSGTNLTWGAIGNATTYTVELATAPSFATKLFSTSQSSTTKATGALSNNTTYYWRVNASNPGGTSDWSTVQSFAVPFAPGTPTLASPANNAADQSLTSNLTWFTVYGADSYVLQVSAVSNFSGFVYNSSVTDTTQAMTTELTYLTKYYWRVRSAGAGGNSNWSAVRNFTSIIQAPPAPTLASPASGLGNVTVTGTTVVWNSAIRATSYSLVVSPNANFSSPIINTTQSDTTRATGSLTAGTTFYWKVNASNVGGTSAWTVDSFAVPSLPAAPSVTAPASGLSTVAVGGTNLQWGAASGASTYTVVLSTAANFSNPSVNTTLSGTSQATGALAAATKYYWEVKSNNNGGSSAWTVDSFSVPAVPSAPSLTSPTPSQANVAVGGTTLTWGASAGATDYNVIMSANANFSAPIVNTSQAGTSIGTGALTAGTKYYWKVNASNNGGTSAWSIDSFSVPAIPAAPSLTSPTPSQANVAVGGTTLTWSASTGATDYNVIMSANANFSSPIVNTNQAGTSIGTGALTAGTKYYWEVNSHNNGGTSAWSIDSFSVPAIPAVPTLVTPTAYQTDVAVGGATMKWNTASGATAYHVVMSAAANYSSPIVDTTTTDTTKVTGALTPGQTYYWEVKTTNNGGASAFAQDSFAVPSLPAAPSLTAPATGLSTVAIGGTNLQWGAASGASTYTVVLSTAANFSNPSVNTTLSGTSQATGALAAATKYYWEVKSNNNGGSSAWTVDSFSVPAVPSAPSLTSPTPNQSDVAVGGTTLTWGASAGATDYNVIMSASANFSSPIVNTSQAGTSIGTGALTAGTKYYWKVNASNNGGTSAWSIDSFSVPAIPAAPSLTSPTPSQANVAVGGTTLTWSASTGATDYNVIMSANANFSSPIVNTNQAGTSIGTGALTAGTKYYWEVNSHNNGGTSAWSIDSFSVPAIPAVPTLVTPTAYQTDVAVGGATMKWNTASGATAYHVVMSAAANYSSPIVDTTTTDTTKATGALTPGQTYYWEVKTTNNGGASAFAQDSFAVPALPAAPSLTAPTTNENDILVGGTTLTWGAAAGAANYTVVLSSAADFSNPIINTSQGGTSKATGALASGTKYYWEVKSNNNGGSSAWTVDSFSVPAIPAAPSLTAPTPSQANVAVGGTTLTWGASAGATDYNVIMSANANFSAPIVNTSQAGTSIGTGALTAGTKYYWKVNAYNNGGTSAWSIDSFSVPAVPAAPGLTAPTPSQANVAVGGTTLTWSASTGATDYNVIMSANANFSSPIVSTNQAGTSIGTGALTAGTKYYWEVNSHNNGGTSAWSIDSFSVPAIPAVPTLVTPTAYQTDVAVGGATMKWNTASGATAYHVVMSAAANYSSPIVDTTTTDTTKATGALTPGQTYYWEVKTTNNGGASAFAQDSFAVPALPAAPSLTAPASGLSTVAIGGTNLQWGAASGASTYTVVLSTAANFSNPSVNTTLSGTSQATGALASATKYYWEVKSNNNGGSSAWTVDSFSVPAVPSAPSLTSPTPNQANVAVGGTTLTWGASAGATDYNVIMSANANFSSPIVNTSQAGTSIGTGALTAGTKYYWKVNASNNGGTSAWSIDSFSVPAIPAAPSLTSPTPSQANVAVGGTTLTWSASTGATDYNVIMSANANFSSPIVNTNQAGTSIGTGALTAGTKYYWEVNSHNNGGTSAWSIDSFSVPAIPAAPGLTAPANHAAGQPVALNLNWGASAGALSYAVQVATDNTFGTTIYGQSGLTATDMAISGLDFNTQYYWHVNGTNQGGTGNWSAADDFTTIMVPSPATPADNATWQATSLNLTWGAVTGASTYHVQLSTVANFSTMVLDQGAIAGTSQAVGPLSNNTTYYWRVYDTTTTGPGGWSAVRSFTTLVGTPVQATPATNATNLSLTSTLTWGTVQGAASYAIEVSTSAAFATIFSSQTGLVAGSASLSGLAYNKKYYWHVNATATGSNSGTTVWSSAWNFTTTLPRPGTPNLAAPVNDSLNAPQSPTLAWGGVFGAATYGLQVSTAADFSTFAYNQLSLTSASQMVGPLADSVQYYWRTNASNSGGTSDWSDAWSFTTIPNIPAAVVLGTPSTGTLNTTLTPTLAWSATAKAASYTLQVSTDAAFASTVLAAGGLSALSQPIASGVLSDSIEYYWRVNATNAAGTGVWSSVWNFTTIPNIPGAVTLSAPASGTLNTALTPAFSWAATSKAVSYALQVSTDAAFASTVLSASGLTGVSQQVASGVLADSVKYYWRMNATNVSGTGTWSSVWNFTTIPNSPVAVVLGTPATGTLNTALTPTLAWSATPKAASYALQVSTDGAFASTVLSTSGLLTVSQAVASGILSDSVEYYWRVNATNAGGTGLWSSVWNFTTIPNIPVAVVLGTPATGTLNTSITPTLAWTATSKAASYTLQVSTDAAFASTVFSVGGILTLSQSVASGALSDSVKYYWRVNATNVSGTGTWSSVWNFTTIPNAPAAVVLTSPAIGTLNTTLTPTLGWSAAAMAASYTLQVSTDAAFASTVLSAGGLSALSQPIASGALSDSVKYFWRVSGTNAAGTGAWSSVWNFTTIPNIPGAVTLSAPASGTLNTPLTPTLAWTATSKAASYTLQVSTDAAFASTVSSAGGLSALSQAIASGILSDSVKYYWRVSATNAAGTGVWSNVWNFTTIPNIPGAVTLSAPASGTLNTILTPTLAWSATAKAASYSLQVSTDAAFVSTVLSAGGLSVLSQPVASGLLSDSVKYYWRVSGTNAAGTGAWSSVWNFTTIPNIPGAVTLSAPASGTLNTPLTPTLAWSATAKAASYTLQVSTDAAFASTVLSAGGLSALSQSVASGILSDSVKYYWRVSATNAAGTSAWSGVWNFTTIPNIPGTVTLSAPASGTLNTTLTPTLAWSATAKAASYSLQVSTDAAFASTVLSSGGLTGVSRTIASGTLSDSVKYFWRVNAANAGGTGVWSSVWNFTTIPNAPAAVSLSSPAIGTINTPLTPTLSWSATAKAASYSLQVSTDGAFASTVLSTGGILTLSQSVASGILSDSVKYYWRVNATNAGGTGVWSSVWNFTTIPNVPAAASLSSPATGSQNTSLTLSLAWSVTAKAASYSLQVSTDAAFATTVLSTSGVLTLSQTIASGILSDSVKYYWRVSATNAAGTGTWSSVWNFTTIPNAPAAVVLGTPATGTQNTAITPTLAWSATAKAASYTLQVSTGAAFASTVLSASGLSGLSQQIASGVLSDSVKYYWRVNATNAGGTGVWSGVWNFTTIPIVPAAVSLSSPVSGAQNTSLTLSLNWSPVAKAASYTMQISASAGFGTTVLSLSGLTGLSQQIASGVLSDSVEYYWRVSATNAAGTGTWSSVWNFTTLPNAPAVVVLSTPATGTQNTAITPTLAWSATAKAASYTLQVSTSAAFASTVLSASGLSGISQQIASGTLSDSVEYYWRVNATNAGGTGVWSGVWNFTTIPNVPVAVVLSSPVNGSLGQQLSLSLGWNMVSRAGSYQMQVSTTTDFSSTVCSTGGLTGLGSGLSGLSASETCYWRVRAANAAGSGNWSAVWSFTTYTRLAVPLVMGWNMISLNVHPTDSNIAAVINAPKDFILVKDIAGNAYAPTVGITDLAVMHTGTGYQMYSRVVDTIRAQGSTVNVAATPIALQAGWNMIGYLPQANGSAATALSGIVSSIMLVKDNYGHVYWPYYSIDDIVTMRVGQGYMVNMLQSAALTYPSGSFKASAHPMLHLPDPRRFLFTANTGNNATMLVDKVAIGGNLVPDSSEIGVYGEHGELVGSGSVINGLAAFAVWGQDKQSGGNIGCSASEKLSFKLWDGKQEYPLVFRGSAQDLRYSANAVFTGSLVVPEGFLIRAFDLSKVYPNPFRGRLSIAFDVPTINGIAKHAVAINLFDVKGTLVKQIAAGQFTAGHYLISWNGEGLSLSSGFYVIQMKAANFDKRIKLIRVR